MYMECSSKEMSGVHEIFDTAIDIAVRGQDERYEVEHAGKTGGNGRIGGVGGNAGKMGKAKKSKCAFL